jgi:hypothetical protein
MKAPRSGKISSLSLRLLKHSQRATARSEEARESRGRALTRPLGQFGRRAQGVGVEFKNRLCPALTLSFRK